LRRNLEAAGFGDIQPYWAAPEVRTPDRLIAADAKAIRRARREGGFREGDSRVRERLMRRMPAAWVKYVAHGHVFIARRPVTAG
jgi:hypothetical protein